MKTILVPIDFSPASKAVLAEAVTLARACKARLILAHVVPPPSPFMDYGMMNVDLSELLTTAKDSARQLLAKWKQKTAQEGIPLQTVEAVGFPTVQILELAQKFRADYIVLGSHGHTAFYDLVIGSTASGVLKHAACAVVIVPAKRPRTRAKR